MVIGADDAALKDREEVFSGVGVLEAAERDIFLGAVVHDAVAVKLAAKAGVDGGFVGHKVSRAVNVGDNQAAQMLGIDVGDMERAGFAVALDQRHNRLLGGGLAGGAVLGLAADIGFIGFDNGVGTAAKGSVAVRFVHSLADAVAEEPSGLVGDADHAAHLHRAHALLGSGHDMGSQKPLVQGNVRALHDAAGADGELVAAIVAEEHASLRIAFHLADAIRATVRAGRTVRPTRGFQMRQRLRFVVKDGVGDIDVHGFFPVEALIRQSRC